MPVVCCKCNKLSSDTDIHNVSNFSCLFSALVWLGTRQQLAKLLRNGLGCISHDSFLFGGRWYVTYCS